MSIIAKYKFDKSIYENLIPVFNDGYTGYTISDEIDNGNNNHIIRTIECDTLPTLIRFGYSDNTPTNTATAASSLLEILQLNISNIVNLGYVFCNCNCLTTVNSSDWDTSNVTNMAYMFNGCQSLTSLDVSNWNTNEVTNMSYMFFQCQKLSSLNMNSWNASKVNDIQFMFKFCNSLTELDLSNWNITNQLSNAYQSLCACQKLKHLNISNWDLSNAHAASMFDINNNLDNIIMKNSNYNSVNKVITALPTRTTESKGTLNITGIDDISQVNTSTANSKCWDIVQEEVENSRVVARYKFDKSIYENLIPVFNDGYTGYTISDEIDSENSNHVIRTIECDTLPTRILFGFNGDGEVKLNNNPNAVIALIDIIDINLSNVVSCIDMFRCCNNLKSFNSSLGLTNITTDVKDFFAECHSLVSLDVSNWDTSNVTDMGGMFVGCRSLTSLDLSNWDTSKVTNMNFMFAYCQSLTSLDVSNFDTSNVTNMQSMFAHCNNLTSIDLSNFNTSNVTNMGSMFNQCNSLTSLDVSNFNTSNVTDMSYMFNNCNKLTSLDISNFNTSKVTNMDVMFHNANKLTTITGIENWDVRKVANMSGMFSLCKSLTSLDLSNWNTESLTKVTYAGEATYGMFQDCNMITEIKLGEGFNTSKVTNMSYMFRLCNNLTSLDVSNWDTSNVTNMESMFHNCNNLTSLDVSRWNVGNVIRMDNLFNSCNELVSIDVSNWNTGNVQNMGSLFGWCFKLQSVDLNNWDTSKVVYMNYMFIECYELTSIGDTSNWDTGNVTDMGWMFDRCQSLTSLDVSNWNTSNVTNMLDMFSNCRLLSSLDVSKWNTGNVRGMRGMFNNCRSLTSLDVNNWDVSKVGETYAMFSDDMSLSTLDLTNWDMSKVSNVGYMFDGKELGPSVNIPVLDLSCLDWSSVIELEGLFYKNNAKAIKLPKIINPNLPSIISERDEGLYGTFYCPNLISLDFGGLNLSNLDSFDIANKHLILEHVPKLRYIRTENAALIDDLAQYFPTRTEAEQGYLITKTEVSDEIRGVLSAKYWNVVKLEEVGTDIAIYKFDKSIYKSMVPVFDNGFVDWFIDDVVEDEVNAPNIVTRTIRSMGGLPTQMRFGCSGDLIGDWEKVINDQRTNSLLSVTYINNSDISTMFCMFYGCCYLKNANITVTEKVNNMKGMYYLCHRIESIDTANWDTSNVTDMTNLFCECHNLTSLDVSDFDTSKVTNIHYMFFNCQSLTSLDVSGFDTRNVGNMSYMFYGCKKLTALDVSNFDTSNVKYMGYMFKNCQTLTSLDVSNFDTSNVTTMQYMFYGCNKLTSLDVSKWNTSKVTNMSNMFYGCQSLTSLDVSNFNTSKVTDMNSMFNSCRSLTSLDVSNFNTSKVDNMSYMFNRCEKLTSLDLSSFNTSKVTTMEAMFAHTYAIKTLDLSSFTTENLHYVNWMFTDCHKLTDLDISNWNSAKLLGTFFNSSLAKEPANIGMIYSNNKAIEKITSFTRKENPTTIWVGNHIDINGLPQYDHITYKVYEVEDKLEVELSSPLLEGDRLEIIDGNLYHYHKMNITTLNGLETWIDNSNEDLIETKTFSCVKPSDAMKKTDNHKGEEISNLFKDQASMHDHEHFYIGMSYINIYINRSRLATLDPNGFKTWLQANPITIVYELTNPYYELVKPNVGLLNAEQGLYLNISDSVVPVVNHQDLCTLKLNYLLPNVQYKVKFKANNAGSIAINLGGALVPLDVVEGWNEVMVTTPETLVDEYLKVNGSEDIKIQNVMVIDSDKDFEYFKGMNNTFDEIPVKNICKNRTLTYTHGVDEEGVSPQGEMNVNVSKGKVVTVIGKVSNNPDNLPISINLYNDTGRATGKNLFSGWLEGQISSDRGVVRYDNEGICSDFISIDRNKDYYISGLVGSSAALESIYSMVTYYNSDKQYIGRSAGSPHAGGQIRLYATTGKDGIIDRDYNLVNATSIIPNNCTYIRITVYRTNSNKVTTMEYLLEKTKLAQIEEGVINTEYEPFRNYVNNDPKFIASSASSVALVDEAIVDVSTTDGEYFVTTIRADRDYANRIGFNVGDASSCEANDQVTITDLMVFEGDILDCHPTTYVDPADTRYLVEYKSIGNPFGFGKNKLI